MADDDDIAEMEAGNIDLVRRDFRGAKITGLNLSGRDFSGAHLEKMDVSLLDLSGSNLSGAMTTGLIARGANLSGVKAPSTAVHMVDFRGANLRNANFARALFAQADLSECDIRGADFSGAVLNEGSSFNDCVVDETTKFDGASIYRPLAKQPAFKFYRVERGLLTRRRGLDSTLDVVGIYGNQPAPKILSENGSIKFDFSNHDGQLWIGVGEWEFQTKWHRGGHGSIQMILNQPSVVGVGVLGSRDDIEKVTIDDIRRVDFTSSYRRPNDGEVVVLRNRNGYFAVLKIIEALSAGHGDQADTLTLQYRILTSDGNPVNSRTSPDAAFFDHDFFDRPQGAEMPIAQVPVLGQGGDTADVSSRIDAILAKLSELAIDRSANAQGQTYGGMGHNNPPEGEVLRREEVEDLRAVLHELREIVKSNAPDPKRVVETAPKILEKESLISNRLARAAGLGIDEFAKSLGKSLGDARNIFLAWLYVSGRLSDLVASIYSKFS